MYKLISAKRLSSGAGGQQIFTKSGGIRKDCTVREIDGSPAEVKEYLDRLQFKATGTPYIFSYIYGEDVFGCKAIVQQVHNGLICSPVELAKELGLR